MFGYLTVGHRMTDAKVLLSTLMLLKLLVTSIFKDLDNFI